MSREEIGRLVRRDSSFGKRRLHRGRGGAQDEVVNQPSSPLWGEDQLVVIIGQRNAGCRQLPGSGMGGGMGGGIGGSSPSLAASGVASGPASGGPASGIGGGMGGGIGVTMSESIAASGVLPPSSPQPVAATVRPAATMAALTRAGVLGGRVGKGRKPARARSKSLFLGDMGKSIMQGRQHDNVQPGDDRFVVVHARPLFFVFCWAQSTVVAVVIRSPDECSMVDELDDRDISLDGLRR